MLKGLQSRNMQGISVSNKITIVHMQQQQLKPDNVRCFELFKREPGTFHSSVSLPHSTCSKVPDGQSHLTRVFV